MDALMKTILTTVADSYDSVKPGLGDCVREKIEAEETITDTTCPKCNSDLEFVSGDYGTGVYAPDGGQETRHQEGYYCERCRYTYDKSDIEDERMPVPCSYPGCKRLTTYDPTYGDLCSSHIRAENE